MGEERISNFLTWQISYSEFVFTDKYWPAFFKSGLIRNNCNLSKKNKKIWRKQINFKKKGYNNMKRVLSALILFPIVLLVFIFGNKYVVDIFVGIIALRCIYELFHAFEQKGHHPVKWIGYLASIAIMFVHIIPKEYLLITIGAIIPISILLLFVLAISKKSNIGVIDIAITFFGICYIVLFLMFMSIIRGMQNGKLLIWYVFITSWMTDVFAYIVGKSFGKTSFYRYKSKQNNRRLYRWNNWSCYLYSNLYNRIK